MSDMLKTLRFVQGSVAKKDFLPALTHFVIEGGKVRGYNGTLALCSPIPFDIECKPKAEPLVRAIANCDDTVSLSLTPAKRLSVRSGSFKAFVDCIEGETPHAEPEGRVVEINGAALLQAMKTVYPFVGEDASRPWGTGALLRGPSVFATNNVSLIEFWTGIDFPVLVNIPRAAIKEIVRIDEPPTLAQVAENSFTLHYADGRWLRTQLLPTDWPDLSKILDVPSNQKPIDPALYTGLDVLRPFVDKMGRIEFGESGISTHGAGDEGASYALESGPQRGTYNVEILRLLRDVADTADFDQYPKPCIFVGNCLRGALMGMRLRAE